MASRKIETEEHSAVTDVSASEHHAQEKPPRGLTPENQQLAKQIGQVCRSARKELSLTQEQVADLIKVNSEFYARIERGLSLPSVTVLVKISKALVVSVDDLFGTPKGMQPNLVERAAQDPPELRCILDHVSKANPSTIRIVSVLVTELERHENSGPRKGRRAKSP